MQDQKRILIVEDSPTVVEHMKMILKNSNVKVLNAGSEFGLMQSIESYGKIVDLILMDLHLKTENGMDIIRNLRKNEKYRNLPIIIITEHASKELILEARSLKVRGYLKKPIQKEIFLDRVYEVIGNVSIVPRKTDTGDSVNVIGSGDTGQVPLPDALSMETQATVSPTPPDGQEPPEEETAQPPEKRVQDNPEHVSESPEKTTTTHE